MTKLLPMVYELLPLGAIKPTGWLRQQLRIQADGLSGHLDEFWPDVRESRWFGGRAEGWERAPYWLDGIIPLAFLLGDEKLIAKAHRYVGEIIRRQQEDGWLGPVEVNPQTGKKDIPAGYDLWAEQLVLKVLVEYHRATGDDKILDVIEKALVKLDSIIDTCPLHSWGQFRWFETLIAIFYLYDRLPRQWLLELALKIKSQGFDWTEFFQHWPYRMPTPHGRWSYMSHVVNNAMAVKSPGLWRRISHSPKDREAAYAMLDKLDQFHGMVTGVFTGDECLAGKSPIHGTELCAVNEFAYSLEWLVGLLGDALIGDRLEAVIFNALPATFSPDMWSHQYDQQVNQVECSIREDRIWTTNGPDSNLFGLEPNYGCCTANLSQGWPKFASSLWMRGQGGVLAAVAYAPCKVETKVKGVIVSLEEQTEYPFRDEVKLTIKVEKEIRFALHLRIPGWAEGAVVWINGEATDAVPGEFFKIRRDWKDVTTIRLHFPMRPRLLTGDRGAVSIVRGPLVYALRMDEDWQQVHADHPERQLPHADFEVYTKSPWNYGLVVDPINLGGQIAFYEHPLGEMPFSPNGAPVTAHVRAYRLPEWKLQNGSAQEVPFSPVPSEGMVETVTLIPYGCTSLRITEFPWVES